MRTPQTVPLSYTTCSLNPTLHVVDGLSVETVVAGLSLVYRDRLLGFGVQARKCVVIGVKARETVVAGVQGRESVMFGMQGRETVVLPRRPDARSPAENVKLSIQRQLEFSSQTLRSGVVVVSTDAPKGSALLFLRGAPAVIKSLVTPTSVPPDFDQVRPRHLSTLKGDSTVPRRVSIVPRRVSV